MLRLRVAPSTLSAARRLLSSAASTASAVPPVCSATVSRWSLRLAHDNTFLSYHRNAIIATVAGTALVQYRKGEGRPPLAAAGLLGMGGLYMYVGSVLYISQTLAMRKTLLLGAPTVAWAAFNASWPLALWTASLACMLDETPAWLLDRLCHVQSMLPAVLHSSFFLESCQLQPIVRMLHTVQEHEQRRLLTVRPQGLRVHTGKIGHVLRRDSKGMLLTNDDYETIITSRLERFAALEAKLAPLAELEQEWCPTATAVPLLDRLHTATVQLEIALDADMRWWQREIEYGYTLRAYAARWFKHRPLQLRMLREELEAVQALKRRCVAVKSGNV